MKKVCPILSLILLVACQKQFDINSKDPKPTVHSLTEVQAVNEWNNGEHWAQTEWSGAHRDHRNSDYIPLISTAEMEFDWFDIPNSNSFMGVTIGPEGKFYATNGDGMGYSHLHAFDRFGNRLWSAPKMESFDDLDYGAFFSNPVIDRYGNVYLGDKDQFRSYTDEGEERWVVSFDDIDVSGYNCSSYFSREGYIGFTTADGQVVFLHTGDGSLALPVLDLPGVKGLPSLPLVPGVFEGDLVAPEMRQEVWDITFGYDSEVSNTPAIDLANNRLFIIATGRKPDQTVLYGIDVLEDRMEIAFETIIGSTGSGTSPTISSSGEYVYITDGTGRFCGVESRSGVIAWRSEDSSVNGVSPTALPGDKVVSFDFNYLKFRDGRTGELIWQADLTEEIGKDYLKGIPALYGDPAADVVSAIIGTSNHLWFTAAVSSSIPIPEDKQGGIQAPVEGIPTDIYKQTISLKLVCYDHNGVLQSVTDSPDSGVLGSVSSDGRVFMNTYSVQNSIAYYGSNPQMPFFMRQTPQPTGGVYCFKPESFMAHLNNQSEWCSDELAANGPSLDIINMVHHFPVIVDEALWEEEISQSTRDELSATVEELNRLSEEQDWKSFAEKLQELISEIRSVV